MIYIVYVLFIYGWKEVKYEINCFVFYWVLRGGVKLM